MLLLLLFFLPMSPASNTLITRTDCLLLLLVTFDLPRPQYVALLGADQWYSLHL